MASESIIRKNAEKGAEFEKEYYELLKNHVEDIGLTLEKQFEITPYWRLDAVFGTENAIDYLKSADSAEQIRNCPHYWGYVENKNKLKRVNAEIAKKQLIINYLLNPYYSAIVQKNNGSEVTHEELFRQSGSVTYDASSQGLENLMQSINMRSRHSRVQIKDSEKIFQENRKELIERIKYLSRYNGSKDKKVSYEVPVIIYKVSRESFTAQTASNILSLGVLFNTTIRLFYESGSRMQTADKLLKEANNYFMKKNNKYLAFTQESSEEIDELLKKHYPQSKFATNVKISRAGFHTACQAAVLI